MAQGSRNFVLAEKHRMSGIAPVTTAIAPAYGGYGGYGATYAAPVTTGSVLAAPVAAAPAAVASGQR